MNDNHEGPAPPPVGARRSCFANTRYTTFLSMSTPNICDMIRAIRGQPNRGLRDLSSTMAWRSAGAEIHFVRRLTAKRRMRQHAVVFVDVERHQATDGG